MKNILKGRSTTLICISSLVVLMLSLSGCIEDEYGASNNKPSNINIIQESSDTTYPTSNNKPSTSNVITYPNSKPCNNVPNYYNNMMEITTEDVTLSMNVIGYYETSDTVDNVLNWYENKLTAMGYYVVEYVPTMKISGPQGTYEYGEIIFEKGNYGIGVGVVRDPAQGRTIYYIVEIFAY